MWASLQMRGHAFVEPGGQFAAAIVCQIAGHLSASEPAWRTAFKMMDRKHRGRQQAADQGGHRKRSCQPPPARLAAGSGKCYKFTGRAGAPAVSALVVCLGAGAVATHFLKLL